MPAARAAALVTFVLATTLSPGSATAQIPTPESVLGFPVGADFQLATYEQSLEYFQRLADASDRVELQEVGRTSFGRPWYLALISSAENIRDAERYREIARRLAYPEPGMTDADARALAREGKAIVHIDGGLHATEVAHAQHTIQLAYDLVTGDDDPEIAAILDDVILVLWFSINPDGQTMVADWYNANVGSPYEVSSAPFLYQKYIGHDNNRDGYMINQIESRVVTRVDRHWEPQIIYNHHQTAPFPTRIWIPPFAEPISPNVHPLMWRTVNLVGMAMAQALEERGQKGAMHMGNAFDNWYPGFIDHANNFHNVASFLTETALYRYATPHFYTVNDFPQNRRDLRPQSLYASPWEGGWWRIRDAIDYMLTASVSVLDVAAKYKEDLLFNRYQAARDVTEQHREAPPYAFFIPADQRDPVAPVEMLRRLAFNGIDVHRLTRAVTYDGVTHPAGTWVIRMDQPNANFVSQLFAVQEYPDLREYPEGPPEQPYDVSGWTLQYLFDVRVVEARTPLDDDFRSALEPVRGEALPWDAEGDAQAWDSPPGVGFDSNPAARAIEPLPGRVQGGGSALVLDAAENNAYKALHRAWNMGAQVRFRPGTPATEEGEAGSSGAWLIDGLSGGQRNALVSDLRLQATGGSASGASVPRPRIALYRPWNASIDEGWTRWLMEVYDFDFQSLRNADVRAGDLRSRYDVIVIGDMSANGIRDGFATGSVPPRYEGGLGDEGTRELDAFVRAGGTLVTLNGSSHYAIEGLHLPVRDVVDDADREDYFVGGAIVELLTDPSHPVMSGMPERAKAFVGSSPVFTVEDGFEGRILAKYRDAGTPLLSGYFLGEEHVHGYAAAVEVEHGEGRVVLLGLRPQWRGQPFGTFKVLFNAALYSDAVADQAPDNDAFWSAPEEAVVEDEEVGSGRGNRR
ncbi:MAG: hypothetical protein HKN72_12405 [Gemmatimonadetes bacterium]|nr:hypothetical protein [Gemmatimonadota bacterium]